MSIKLNYDFFYECNVAELTGFMTSRAPSAASSTEVLHLKHFEKPKDFLINISLKSNISIQIW